MDDDLDDIYGDSSASPQEAQPSIKPEQEPQDVKMTTDAAEASSGDSSDDESDIEFVIETKPGQRAEPPANKPLPYSGAKVSKPAVKTEDGKISSATEESSETKTDAAGIPAPVARKEPTQKLPNVDVDAIANLDGKSILEIDLETLDPKPWRQEGADITDYFNYGFDEFTWTAYVNKQKQIRSEYTPDKVMANMLPDPMMMMPDPTMMGGFPGAMDPMFMQGMFNGQQGFPGQPPFMPPQHGQPPIPSQQQIQQMQQQPQQQLQQQAGLSGPPSRAMQQANQRPSHSPAPAAPDMPKIPTGPSKGPTGPSKGPSMASKSKRRR